jgi:hypothetical protein
MRLFELYNSSEDKDHNHKASSDKDGHGDIDIRDPLARRILDKARSRYAYAETDLEAFVKMMQDDQKKDHDDISVLRKEEERLGKDLTKQIAINDIQAKQISQQRQDVAYLEMTRKEYKAKEKQFDELVASLQPSTGPVIPPRRVSD